MIPLNARENMCNQLQYIPLGILAKATDLAVGKLVYISPSFIDTGIPLLTEHVETTIMLWM